MSKLQHLSNDELIREVWTNGTEREREIVRRLEMLRQQINELCRRDDYQHGVDIAAESMFHVKQAK